jgi:hypothetical protein
MSDRNSASSRTTLSVTERKPAVRKARPDRNNPDRIDRFRPLTFSSAASKTDLDVQHVCVFPEGNSIVMSLMTNRGTATFCMQPITAKEVGDGLSWLAREEQKAT